MPTTSYHARRKGGLVDHAQPRTRRPCGTLMPVSRWNDDRLDDLARQVQINTDAIKEHLKIREELIEVKAELRSISDDTHECRADVKSLKDARDVDRKAQEERDLQQHKERKADRRWMIATALTTAGLIIAALAIFIG